MGKRKQDPVAVEIARKEVPERKASCAGGSESTQSRVLQGLSRTGLPPLRGEQHSRT